LTICTADRRPLFASREVVDAVLWQFRTRADAEGFAVFAYCFMRDHVHLLLEGRRADADLVSFVKMAKQGTGFWYRRHVGDRLWQEGYFERVLRSEEDTEAVARYILGNPVRAGCVACIAAWPFSGSDVFDIREW
jgi:putative transposase